VIPTTVIYAALRAVAAIPLGVALWRDRQQPLVSVAQTVADLGAVLFLLGLTFTGLRTTIGLWWVVLFLYTAIWEAIQFRTRLQDVMNPPAGDASGMTFEGAVAGWGMIGLAAWELVGVALPLAAGFGLAFDAVAPNELTFPKLIAP
jgi:hypothetical protein